MSMKQRILGRVDELQADIRLAADYLCAHPEPAMQEYLAMQYCCDWLEKEGFDVTRGLAGMDTAFSAIKRSPGSQRGPRIAFIAEYDALAGLGHACGHHLIAAMSIGAALALSTALEAYPGEIAVIGTPGEELGHGKPRLIEAGVFEGFHAAMMIHPSARTSVCPPSLCLGGFEFRYTGASAHAGMSPHDGVNALDAVVLLYTAINALRQQLRSDARVHGIILEAGSAVNIIPDKSRVRLEIRAADTDYYGELVQKVVNCAKAAALATGCTLDYGEYEPHCKSLTHHPALVSFFRAAMDELGVHEEGAHGTISTDMGNLSAVVPAIHPMLKVAEDACGLHTPEFLAATRTAFARDRVITGAKLLALTGLAVLENTETLTTGGE